MNTDIKYNKVVATLLYNEGEIISFWLFKESNEDDCIEYFDTLEDMLNAWIMYHLSGASTTVEVLSIENDQII